MSVLYHFSKVIIDLVGWGTRTVLGSQSAAGVPPVFSKFNPYNQIINVLPNVLTEHNQYLTDLNCGQLQNQLNLQFCEVYDTKQE